MTKFRVVILTTMFSSSVLLLPSAAMAAGKWVDSRTGETVASGPVITDENAKPNPQTYYILPDVGDTNHAHDPRTGRNFFYDEKTCIWKDSLTGKTVASGPVITDPNATPNPATYYVLPDVGDRMHAHDPRTGRNFFRNCPPPPKTATPAPPPEHASTGGGTHTGPYVELAAGAAFVQGTNPAVIGGLGMQNETGFDVAASGGYDFGRFRLEAELAYKRARTTEFRLTPPVVFGGPTIAGPFFDSPRIDSPQVALPPGQAYVADGPGTTLSFMLNGMLDFGPDDGLQGFVGGGAGIARTHHRLSINRLGPGILDQTDTTFAWQALAGIRAPITDHIDVTFKYRFFNTSQSDFIDPKGQAFVSKWRSHSILAGLTYNFGAPPPEPEHFPVAPAEPPPVEGHPTDSVM